MKTTKTTIILICVLLSVFAAKGQISTNELPVSFSLNNIKELSGTMAKKVMPALDMATIEREDSVNKEKGIFRYGFPHYVNYNLNNSGEWITLENGDKLWRLEIYCPNALSIDLVYDKFWLPEGAKLFIYNADRSHSIGAFTSENNKCTKNDIQGFATSIVHGDKSILEYYLPNNVSEQGVISIKYVIHGYHDFFSQTDWEGPCKQVNINCSEGQNWQQEKNAVAKVSLLGASSSGFLINTTANDRRPYFITADHCLCKVSGERVYDAIDNPNIRYVHLYWHEEYLECNNNGTAPYVKTTTGAIVLANSNNKDGNLNDADFALLELIEDPNKVCDINTYYLGWDRSGNATSSGVCIHHPNSMPKKIATFNQTPTTSSYFADKWYVRWTDTENGFSVPLGGSSGAPLLNNKRRVIGQVSGGFNSSDCADPVNANPSFGKFSVAWTGVGSIDGHSTEGVPNPDKRRRLSDWLDPLNTGQQTLNGIGGKNIDLLVRDDKQDNGKQPNPASIQWNSPDIWLTNDLQNYTPLTNSQLDNLYYCYVAVRIKNIGCVASTGNEKLHIYWKKSSINSMWKSSWLTGTPILGNPQIGGEITPTQGINVLPLLQPNNSVILLESWYFPDYIRQYNESINPFFSTLKARPNWGFALLARVDDGNYTDGLNEKTLATTTFAKNSNNVAVSNGSLLLFSNDYSNLMYLDASDLQNNASIGFNQILIKDQYKLSDFAEVYALLSNDLMGKLNKTQSKGIKIADSNRVLLASENSELVFNSLDRDNGVYFIGTEVNFIADKMPELNEFNLDFTLKTDGADVETMRYTAVRDADVYFKAHAEASKTKIVRGKEEATLTSNTIPDEATYTWLDEGKNIIGDGTQFTVSPAVGQNYTIEIQKEYDGFKSYGEVEVIVVDGIIKSLSPNPAQNNVTVNYLLADDVTNATIQIANIFGNVQVSLPLSTTQEQQDISLLGLVSGNYIVQLVINGFVVDSQSLIIK